MKNNNEITAPEKWINYLNDNYTHDTKRHFRALTPSEYDHFYKLLNDSEEYLYEPYATDGTNIVSVFDAYGTGTNYLFSYISSIEEGLE